MSDDPEHLVYASISRCVDRIGADVGNIKTDITEIKERLGFLEGIYASISRRVDRIGADVERINVRLDLVEP